MRMASNLLTSCLARKRQIGLCYLTRIFQLIFHSWMEITPVHQVGEPMWKRLRTKRQEDLQTRLRTIQATLERPNHEAGAISNVGERHRKRMNMSLGRHSRI